MSATFSAYILANWDGWPLHVAIAALLMHPIITNSYPWLMFAMHCVYWPMREVWQHEGLGNFWTGLANIWTPHRMIEWGAPILAAFIMLLICLRWPYRRKK